MNDFTFTFRFRSPVDDVDELSVLLYDRIDDASLMGPDEDGLFLLEFERQASSLPQALLAALDELLGVVPKADVLRVEEDDLATMGDIAKRAGRTPESIRLLVSGARGPGGFPAPAGRVGARTKVWRWSEVGEWFRDALGSELDGTSDSAFIQAFNDALELRRLASSLESQQQRAIAEVLPSNLISA